MHVKPKKKAKVKEDVPNKVPIPQSTTRGKYDGIFHGKIELV
jgi:hypothetical protein